MHLRRGGKISLKHICLNSKSIILNNFDYNHDIVISLTKWSKNLYKVEYRRIFRNNANTSSLIKHYGNYLGFNGLFSFDKNLLKKVDKNIRYNFDKWRLNHMHHDFYYHHNILDTQPKYHVFYR